MRNPVIAVVVCMLLALGASVSIVPTRGDLEHTKPLDVEGLRAVRYHPVWDRLDRNVVVFRAEAAANWDQDGYHRGLRVGRRDRDTGSIVIDTSGDEILQEHIEWRIVALEIFLILLLGGGLLTVVVRRERRKTTPSL